MSLSLFCDASTIAKRYIEEPGSAVLDALFSVKPFWYFSYLTYAEIANIIRRNYNRGVMTKEQFENARTKLEQELLLGERVELVSLSEIVFLDSIPLADTPNLNVTDAALLLVLSEIATMTSEPFYLLCSDLRFIRAAESLGVTCLNPETHLL